MERDDRRGRADRSRHVVVSRHRVQRLPLRYRRQSPSPVQGLRVGVVRLRETKDAAPSSITTLRRPRPRSPGSRRSSIPSAPASAHPLRVRVIRWLVWGRRFAQIFFFAPLHATSSSRRASAAAPPRCRRRRSGSRSRSKAFLLADPFVGAMTLLSTHTVYRRPPVERRPARTHARLRSLVLRMDLPLRHSPSFLRLDLPLALRAAAGNRVEANKTHTYQRVKYYLLYAFLIAAVAESAIGGMFDPDLHRGPLDRPRRHPRGAITSPGEELGAAQDVHSRPLQSAADHTQDFRRADGLAVEAVSLPARRG